MLAACSMLLASCTGVVDPDLQAGTPGYNAASPDPAVQAQVVADTGAGATPADPTATEQAATPNGATGGNLPAEGAALPSDNPQQAGNAATPGTANAAVAAGASADAALPATAPAQPGAAQPGAALAGTQMPAPALTTPPPAIAPKAPRMMSGGSGDRGGPVVARAAPRPQPAEPAAPPAIPSAEQATEPVAATNGAAADSPIPAQQSAKAAGVDPATAGDGSVATATEPAAEPAKPKPQGLMASFFGGGAKSNVAAGDRDSSGPTVRVARATPPPKVASARQTSARQTSQIDLSVAEETETRSTAFAGGGDALPGVRQSALFEIKRRSGLDDDADVDIYEEDDYGPVQLASAAGMARLAPNGLKVQTESVDVACLKPSLVRVLKQMERQFGQKMLVTSGYRDPSRNRRARGAKNSLHMYCAAVDVQIPGVSKAQLANYARSMPGRGGVGTYCHTNSIHIDVGPERDWNWRCRGRRRR